MVFKRKNEDSDDEYVPPEPKRGKKMPKVAVERATSLPVSPREEPGPYTPSRPSTPQSAQPTVPLPSLSAVFGLETPVASGSRQTLETSPDRAQSMEPPTSSPLSSVVDLTPVKDPRGRPAYTPDTRKLVSTIRQTGSNQDTPTREAHWDAAQKLAAKKEDAAAKKAQAAHEVAAQKARERIEAEAEREKNAAAAQKLLDTMNTLKAQQVLADLTKPTEEGGYNFNSLDEFFQACWRPGGDQHMSALLSRYVRDHGADHARGMFGRSIPAKEEYISGELAEIYQREGRAIQEILTRDSTMAVTDLLKVFSMDALATELEAAAPWLWKALVAVSDPDTSTRRESAGKARRDKGLVCCLKIISNHRV